MSSNFEFRAAKSGANMGPILFSFATAYNRILREFSIRSGLYSGQPRILTCIVDRGGCTLSELSELTGTGMPSLSVSVRNMRKAGLLEDNERRSRNKALIPTEEGVRKATAFHEEFDSFMVAMSERFGEQCVAEMSDMLGELADFFDEYMDGELQKEGSPE